MATRQMSLNSYLLSFCYSIATNVNTINNIIVVVAVAVVVAIDTLFPLNLSCFDETILGKDSHIALRKLT